MAHVGCAAAPPISGQLTIEGILVLGLVDTGASITCLGFAIWWHYRAQWGVLRQFEGTVHGAHGKPLNIAGKTEHLDIQWGEARGRASHSRTRIASLSDWNRHNEAPKGTH